ncbi:hypothetical protein L7F22_029030 [Adiantum nelumboides]|nr:hypothetical protein [Adiantum nelumboides]
MCWLWRRPASSPPLSPLLPSPSPLLVIHWPFCCKTALRRSLFSEENDHQHFIPSSAFRSVSRVSRSTIYTDAVAIPVQHFLSIASVTLLSQSAMSFWTCPACTFVNQGASSKCDMCEQTKKSSARGNAPFLSLNASQQDNASKWGCRACTFLNKDSDNRCDICGTPKSSISLDSFPEIDSTLDDDVEGGENRGTTFWPLRSCTGSLPESQESSQKHVEGSSPSTSTVPFATQERAQPADRKRKYQEDGEAVLSNDSDCGKSIAVSSDMLRNLHFEKMQRSMQSQADINQRSLSPPRDPLARTLASDSSSVGGDKQSIIILTYNVWFREDLEVVARMDAIGTIILEHSPHFICFQEVTPAIYGLFQRSSWWDCYKCSVPPGMVGKRAYFCLLLSRIAVTLFHRKSYNNSVMGRELCIAETDAGEGRQLFVATTHLESPCPAPPTWDQMFSSERVSQAKQALNTLMSHQNVVFGGDMNWDDKLDGAPPLPADWCDAWVTLRPNEEGLTYDSKQNPLLTGSRLRKRLDRIFCHLQDFRLDSIEMVGTKPIPGIMFEKEIKAKKQAQKVKLPVLPSDHFGLLLKIIQKV